MSLGRYEKKLISILEKNSHINTRKFIQLAGLGKTTFYKYTRSLEIEGYISHDIIKNEKEWYLIKSKKNQDWGILDFETTKKNMDTRYDEIESKVLQAIKKAKAGTANDKITGYGNSVLLLLSTLSLFKIIYHYKKKRVSDLHTRFVKRIEVLLEKILDEKFFPEYGYGRLSLDHVIRTTEDQLDEFLGIKKEELHYA